MTSLKMIINMLLTSLRLTGLWCKNDTVFVYSRLGASTVLPCRDLAPPDCSLITWTFYKSGQVRYTQEVTEGRVRADSDKSSRMSVTSNCSIGLRDLRVNDAGSYVCLKNGHAIANVYLSLLTITALSKINDLQPGGNLTLNCILFTYYDAGSCKSYSSMFQLSWVTEDGIVLPEGSRYELIVHTRCNITLITKLQREDNNRKWRCQMKTIENSRGVFQDFTSAFLFQNPSTVQTSLTPMDCPAELPISRIMLCLALPVTVIIVGVFTRKRDGKRANTSTADC